MYLLGVFLHHLFPNSQKTSKSINPYISNNTANKALRIMGYTKEQQTAHGFRAMFKSVCKEHQESNNLKNEFVEKILAHKIESNVEASYNRASSLKDMKIILKLKIQNHFFKQHFVCYVKYITNNIQNV